MSRSAGPQGPKDEYIQVRCTAAEKALVQAHAKAAGMNKLSEFVLQLALAPKIGVLSPDELAEIRRCEETLRRVGVNLNQLTRDTNSVAMGMGAVEPITRERIAGILAQVELTVEGLVGSILPVRKWLTFRRARMEDEV